MNEAKPETTGTAESSVPPEANNSAAASGSAEAARHLRHEMRTPLNQILGYSEMLLEEIDDDKSALATDLTRIRAAGQHLLSLVETHIREPAEGASDAWNATSQGDGSASSSALPSFDDAQLEPTTTVAPPGQKFARRRSDVWRHEYSYGAEEADERPSREAGTLLVVDDNEANRDLLSRRLQRQGHQVEVAVDGAQALQMATARPFDVILLDIMMPELDGYEVLRRLKEDAALRHVPVIMISALEEMESVVRCIEMGAEDYLPKPFDPVLLRARVGASLEKKRLRDREVGLFEQLQSQYTRLRELEILRDDLTHMIIHDLRTPLTSLMGGLQTMEMIGAHDDISRELLQISMRSAKSLLALINDLLDISKMEAGQMQLHLRPLAASSLVEHALQQIAFLAEDKRLLLQHDIAPAVPSFAGDEDKLRRTLVNLLGNAIKFTSEDTTIFVSVTIDKTPASDQAADQTGGAVIFSVRDEGQGIPREALGRIFEKFRQVETDTDGQRIEQRMSTGLGLTFCKLAVEAHGGTIWVESEVNRGSTFSFRIPLSLQAP